MKAITTLTRGSMPRFFALITSHAAVAKAVAAAKSARLPGHGLQQGLIIDESNHQATSEK